MSVLTKRDLKEVMRSRQLLFFLMILCASLIPAFLGMNGGIDNLVERLSHE
jgi:hypothetical protein